MEEGNSVLAVTLLRLEKEKGELLQQLRDEQDFRQDSCAVIVQLEEQVLELENALAAKECELQTAVARNQEDPSRRAAPVPRMVHTTNMAVQTEPCDLVPTLGHHPASATSPADKPWSLCTACREAICTTESETQSRRVAQAPEAEAPVRERSLEQRTNARNHGQQPITIDLTIISPDKAICFASDSGTQSRRAAQAPEAEAAVRERGLGQPTSSSSHSQRPVTHNLPTISGVLDTVRSKVLGAVAQAATFRPKGRGKGHMVVPMSAVRAVPVASFISGAAQQAVVEVGPVVLHHNTPVPEAAYALALCDAFTGSAGGRDLMEPFVKGRLEATGLSFLRTGTRLIRHLISDLRKPAAALAVWLATAPTAGPNPLRGVSACVVPLPDSEGEASQQPGLVISLDGCDASADWITQQFEWDVQPQREWVFAGDFLQSVGCGFDRASGRCYSVEWAAAAAERLPQVMASMQQRLGLQLQSARDVLDAMRLPPARQGRAAARARAVAAIVLQHHWGFWREGRGSWRAADREQLEAAVVAGR